MASSEQQQQQQLPSNLFKRTPSASSASAPAPARRSSSSRSRTRRAPPLVNTEDDDPAFPKRFARTQSSTSTSTSTSSSYPAPGGAMNTEEQNRLLYAMEAEEEALVNSLSRKLEQLRAEKIALESTLEMEQEQLVNRLQRQLSQLLTQQQATESSPGPSTFSLPSSPVTRNLPLDASSSLGPRARVGSASAPYVYSPPLISSQTFSTSLNTSSSAFPPPANLSALLQQQPSSTQSGNEENNDVAGTLLRVLQSENTDLKTKLADAQNDADRQSRISESYRSELLHLRRSAGLDIADLLPSSSSSFSGGGGVQGRQGRSEAQQANATGTTGSIRIPGAAQSPPSRSRSASKSSYSPASASFSPDMAFSNAGSTSLSSASISFAPSRSGTSAATTPSVSYTTPTVPASTPVHHVIGLPSALGAGNASGTSTPFGSSTSTSSLETSRGPSGLYGMGQHRPPAYKVPPPSLASSLGSASGFPGAVSPYALSTSPIPEVLAEGGEGYSGTSSPEVHGSRRESLERRLSSSRSGARVAETGMIPDRRSAMQRKASENAKEKE